MLASGRPGPLGLARGDVGQGPWWRLAAENPGPKEGTRVPFPPSGLGAPHGRSAATTLRMRSGGGNRGGVTAMRAARHAECRAGRSGGPPVCGSAWMVAGVSAREGRRRAPGSGRAQRRRGAAPGPMWKRAAGPQEVRQAPGARLRTGGRMARATGRTALAARPVGPSTRAPVAAPGPRVAGSMCKSCGRGLPAAGPACMAARSSRCPFDAPGAPHWFGHSPSSGRHRFCQRWSMGSAASW